jgi:hypothetical protein
MVALRYRRRGLRAGWTRAKTRQSRGSGKTCSQGVWRVRDARGHPTDAPCAAPRCGCNGCEGWQGETGVMHESSCFFLKLHLREGITDRTFRAAVDRGPRPHRQSEKMRGACESGRVLKPDEFCIPSAVRLLVVCMKCPACLLHMPRSASRTPRRSFPSPAPRERGRGEGGCTMQCRPGSPRPSPQPLSHFVREGSAAARRRSMAASLHRLARSATHEEARQVLPTC